MKSIFKILFLSLIISFSATSQNGKIMLNGVEYTYSGSGSGGTAQQLSLNASTNVLTLDNGGTVDLSAYKQTITALNVNTDTNILTVTLSNGNTATVDLSHLDTAAGSTNQNIFVPSTITDFTTGTSARTNKIWRIEKDFDLVAENFTVPDGVILDFKGGKITTTGSVNFTNSVVKSEDPTQQIFEVGDVSGIIKSEISANWFGLKDTGDNRATLLLVSKLQRSSYSKVKVYNTITGNYPVSVVQNEAANQNFPSNIVISGDNVHWEGVPNEYGIPKFKILGHNFSGSELFQIHEANGGSFKYIGIIGERDEHTISSIGAADERNHNIVVGSGVYDFLIEGNSFTKSEADGIYFVNDIDASNGHTTLDYTQGNVVAADGTFVADEFYMYSNVTYPINSLKFQEQGKFMVTGGSSGTAFNNLTFYAAYYDATDTYIGKSERLYWYESINIPPTAEKVRIILPYTPDNYTIRVACPYISERVVIRNNYIAHNNRQGISNPGQQTLIEYNWITDTGKKSPSAGMDGEDGFQAIRNIIVRHNWFKNNYNAAIILKAASDVIIENNYFLANDRLDFVEGSNGSGIQGSRGLFTQIVGNTFYDENASIGRKGVARGLMMHGGQMRIINEESVVDGGTFHNVWFNNIADTIYPGRAWLKNARLFYDKPIENPIFTFFGSLIVENTFIDLGDLVIDGSPQLVQEVSLIGRSDTNGYIDGLTIIGGSVQTDLMWTQGIKWPVQNIFNFDSSIPLHVLYGQQRNAFFKNIKVPRLRIRPRDFSATSTNIVDFHFQNLVINTDDVNYTNFSAYPLEADPYDYNLIIEGGRIDVITGISKIMSLKNTGYKLIKNLIVRSVDPITIDLNTVASGGPATFINCDFGSNITVVLRTGDRILTTGSAANASQIPVTPSGNLTSTDTQSALQELQIEIDGISGTPAEITAITQYTQASSLPSVTGNETDTYAYVIEDSNRNKNGLYAIIDGSWQLLYEHGNPYMPVKRTYRNEINLSDPNIVDGSTFALNADGTEANAAKYITNYIPVKYGDRLLKLDPDRFRYYYQDSTAIPFSSGLYPGTTSNDEILIDSPRIKYVRWASDIADKNTRDMIVKQQNSVAGAEPVGWDTYHGYERDNQNYTYDKNGLIFKNNSTNLFDVDFAVFTEAYSTGGSTVSDASSGFISATPGAVYSHNLGANQSVTFWDNSGVFVSTISAQAWQQPAGASSFNLRIPRTTPDWSTVAITANNVTNHIVSKSVNQSTIGNEFPLNISVCLMGDSIGTENSTYATQGGYASLMREALNIKTFLNVSVSGKAMSHYAADLNTGAYNVPSDYDVYIIALGTNDFGFNRALGTLSSLSTDANFYGNMKKVRADILALNASAQFIWLTPLIRSNYETANVAGNYLQDYRDAIIKLAKFNGDKVIDLFTSGLNPTNPIINTNYFIGADGLHPNNKAHKAHVFRFVAPQIKPILESFAK